MSVDYIARLSRHLGMLSTEIRIFFLPSVPRHLYSSVWSVSENRETLEEHRFPIHAVLIIYLGHSRMLVYSNHFYGVLVGFYLRQVSFFFYYFSWNF